MTDINTFQDILDALEQDPALREQLRRHILTEELLQLPAAVQELRTDVAELKNGVTEIKTDVAELKNGVTEIKTDVAELKNDVTEIKADVAELKNDVTELKTDVAELKNDVTELKTDVAELKNDVTEIKTDVAELKTSVTRLETNAARMGGDLRRITGKDYEGYILRFAERLINRNTDLERPSVVGSDRNGWESPHMRERNTEAANSGTIEFEEADDLELADIILSGRTPQGGARYVIIEASITVEESDVSTAKIRAEILQKVSGITTIPVVVGVIITEEATAAAQEGGVRFIQYNPGEQFSPAEAETGMIQPESGAAGS